LWSGSAAAPSGISQGFNGTGDSGGWQERVSAARTKLPASATRTNICIAWIRSTFFLSCSEQLTDRWHDYSLIMNNENNLRTFLRLIAWRIVARWMTREG
jgi:hypothetical protein